MDPHPVTVPNDDDVVTVGAVFDNPFLYFFVRLGKILNIFSFFCHSSSKIFFVTLCLRTPFLYFFCVSEKGLKYFLSFFATLVANFFLSFFDRHENQVPCCTLLVTA